MLIVVYASGLGVQLIDHDVAIVPRGSVYLDASHKVKQNKAYEGRLTVLTWLEAYLYSQIYARSAQACMPHATASMPQS